MKSASQPAKHVFVPVVLFAGAIMTTVILMWLISKSVIASRSLDFNIFDTYIIVEWIYLSLPVFLLVTFVLFFTRELIVSHSNAGKLIAMVSGILIFLLGCFVIGIDARIDHAPSSWTVLPPGFDQRNLKDLFNYNFKPIVVITQIILLFAMIFLAYRWGRERSSGG